MDHYSDGRKRVVKSDRHKYTNDIQMFPKKKKKDVGPTIIQSLLKIYYSPSEPQFRFSDSFAV